MLDQFISYSQVPFYRYAACIFWDCQEYLSKLQHRFYCRDHISWRRLLLISISMFYPTAALRLLSKLINSEDLYSALEKGRKSIFTTFYSRKLPLLKSNKLMHQVNQLVKCCLQLFIVVCWADAIKIWFKFAILT
jgi:hypothetical protein